MRLHETKRLSHICIYDHRHLKAKALINFLLFALHYCTFAGAAGLICCASFFCLIPYCKFNVISLLSQNTINEGLPTPSTESQSRPI